MEGGISSTVVNLVIVEAVLTAIGIVLFVYRGFLDMKEDDHLILDAAEEHLVREQKSLRARVKVLSKYLMVVGIAWGILAVTTLFIWVNQSLKLI